MAVILRISSTNVWARQLIVDGNVIRQLLVPEGDYQLVDDTGDLRVEGKFGRWPATRSAGRDPGLTLTAKVPMIQSNTVRATWIGSRELIAPSVVTDSYVGAISFAAPNEPNSLRRPQIGALHSVIGYWSSGLANPAIVVMPTGTGKTETMIALLIAGRVEKLLVLVPTASLRDQIAQKFERLGILQEREIVASSALRPCVGKLEHGFKTIEAATEFSAASNVVVATSAALNACSAEARESLLNSFSHLVVDEAHHAPAPTWTSVIDAFESRRVLLFTATPYREDRRPIPGRVIFRFPLREAQRDGYFTHIDFQTVLSLSGTDEVLADLAIGRLREDRSRGLDHVLLARAKSITRAEQLLEIYRNKGEDLNPMVLHDQLSSKKRKAVLSSLASRDCRVVICVDMLGEGFDLPALKVAAIHDVKKSLSPMIQLIGRFSRSPENDLIGDASVFVARDPSIGVSPLRDLLREDPDWDQILHHITERASEAIEQLSDFESSFTGAPEDVSVTSLEPKMSAVAHRAPTADWIPECALDVFGADSILGSSLAMNADSSVVWFVVEHRSTVRWGTVLTLEELSYELIVMLFEASQRLLFIYGSENSDSYDNLAHAVLGEDSHVVNGPSTFRVLAYLDRLIPTNVGLLDIRDHFNRFSMHVGSDVMEALELADRQGKSQTHIVTSGFDQGEKVTISAALSGRFWSMRSAANLKEWADWCLEQGTKLLDESIDLDEVLAGFLIPEDLSERPQFVLLGLEWPWELFTGFTPGVSVSFSGTTVSVLDIGFRIDDYSTTGPFRFSLMIHEVPVPYEADFDGSGLRYRPLADDAVVASRPTLISMGQWINKNKPSLFLEGDRMVTPEDRLLAPRTDLPPFDRTRLNVLSWGGVNIRVESQGPERRPDSIQAHMSAYLRETDTFDVLLDDDRTGEAADLVGVRIDDADLIVTLVHCKFSSGDTPGGRLKDLYELCGQAVRSAKWRQHGSEPLLYHLGRRAQHYAVSTGASPFEVGDIEELFRVRQLAPQLRPRFRMLLVQPGLSASVCTDEHLRLLAGAESYVRAVTKGVFEVFCSK